MTKTCVMPVLSVLYQLNSKFKKKYCFPGQKKIIELIEEYQGIKRSVRTLNRWLRYIEDKKFIRRKRRIKKDPVKGVIFKSTLYKITYKGYRALWRCGVDCYEQLEEMSKKKEKPKHNKEIPEPQPASQGKAVSRGDMRRIWEKVKLRTFNVLSLFV